MDSIVEMNAETGREFSHTNPQDDPHLYPQGLNLDWEGKVRPSPTTVIRSSPVNPAIYYPRDDTKLRISEYRIANSELEVNNYIKQGYVPFGNVSVVSSTTGFGNTITFFQPMVKYA